MYNLKKYTQKDRYGNSITVELESMQQPTVPSMQDIPPPEHPGGPKGTDTVPAWLTPGEFVMNAEATRMYEPQIKAMNDHGRAVQRAQGGTIPEGIDRYVLETTGQGTENAKGQRIIYEADGGKAKADTSWVTEELLDGLKFSESSNRHYDKDGNLLTSKAGAVGAYQFIPKYATKGMGYGVAPFDVTSETAQRKAAGEYLRGMQKHYPDWDPTDVLRAYNWGPGNVRDLKEGWLTRYDIPDEAMNYPGKVISNAVKKPWVKHRAEGSVNPEVPNPDYAFFLDNGLPAIDPSNDAYPPEYAMDNYVYNTTPEKFDQQMDQELDRVADIVERNAYNNDSAAVQPVPSIDEAPPTMPEHLVPKMPYGTPEPIREAAEAKARKRWEEEQRISSMGGDEYGDESSTTGGVEPLTFDDQKKVEEGRQRRLEDYSERLAKKLERGEELTETEKTTLAELERSRNKQIDPVSSDIDPDAPGEDMNVTYDMQAAKPTEKKEVDPGEEEMDVAVNEFKKQQESEKGDSWLDSFMGKDTQDAIGGFFSDMFNQALNKRALGQLVMHYAGTRLMGYDHGTAVQHSLKKYGKQIEANQALGDKLYLSGKYSAPSVKEAMAQGDLGLLKLAKGNYIAQGDFKDFYKDGETYRAQNFKDANGNTYWIGLDKKGKKVLIDSSFHQDKAFQKDTPEYRERRSRANKTAAERYSRIEKTMGTYEGPDKKDKYYVNFGPDAAASQYWKFMESMGLDPESDESLTVMENAYKAAIKDGQSAIKDGKAIPGRLTPYLQGEWIREATGSNDLFIINSKEVAEGKEPPRYARGDLMKQMINNVENIAKNKMPETYAANQSTAKRRVVNAAMEVYNKLSPEDKAKYEKAGKNDSRKSGFMIFFDEELQKIMQSL